MPSRADAAWEALRAAAAPRPEAGAGAGVASLLKLQTPLEKRKRSGDGGKAGNQTAAALRQWAGPATKQPSQAKRSAQQQDAADPGAVRAAAAAALAAVRPKQRQSVVRTFAGEKVEMFAGGNGGAEAAPAAKAAPASGLDALVSSVVEKKEGGVSTLKKTQSDWQKVKAEGGAELEDELETHKRSGKTYLDKQAFLKKAEWTEYERDREAKLKAEGVAR